MGKAAFDAALSEVTGGEVNGALVEQLSRSAAPVVDRLAARIAAGADADTAIAEPERDLLQKVYRGSADAMSAAVQEISQGVALLERQLGRPAGAIAKAINEAGAMLDPQAHTLLRSAALALLSRKAGAP